MDVQLTEGLLDVYKPHMWWEETQPENVCPEVSFPQLTKSEPEAVE